MVVCLVHASYFGMDDRKKDHFYIVLSMLRVSAWTGTCCYNRGLDGHIGGSAENYDDEQRVGIRNQKGERFEYTF